MSYRAKFRVLSRTEQVKMVWVENRSEQKPVVLVELRPVTTKSKWTHEEEDACEENRVFWDATPSGSMEIEVGIGDAKSYDIGQAFYVDFRPDIEGTWRLSSFSYTFGGSLQLYWHPCGNVHGKLNMSIGLQMTVRSLLDVIEPAMRDVIQARIVGDEKSSFNWSVVLTPVPG